MDFDPIPFSESLSTYHLAQLADLVWELDIDHPGLQALHRQMYAWALEDHDDDEAEFEPTDEEWHDAMNERARAAGMPEAPNPHRRKEPDAER